MKEDISRLSVLRTMTVASLCILIAPMFFRMPFRSSLSGSSRYFLQIGKFLIRHAGDNDVGQKLHHLLNRQIQDKVARQQQRRDLHDRAGCTRTPQSIRPGDTSFW